MVVVPESPGDILKNTDSNAGYVGQDLSSYFLTNSHVVLIHPGEEQL